MDTSEDMTVLPATSSMSDSAASTIGVLQHGSSFQPGRVLRLHFTCRAELPIGSFLRVTGSTLWAPGSSALDPTDAAPTIEHLNQVDYNADDTNMLETSNLYTSSVEMVTTPETYPVWTTRRPVILVWNRRGRGSTSSSGVLHHYYRYLVVAPGTLRNVPFDDIDTDNAPVTVQTSTSNEASNTGSTIVMEWEDPFHTLLVDDVTVSRSGGGGLGLGLLSKSRNVSAVSLNSSVHLASMAHSGHQYRNLPYRTVDVAAHHENDGSNTHVIQVSDHWNHPDDPTFQPYRIREAVRFCACSAIYCGFFYSALTVIDISLVPADSSRKSSQTHVGRSRIHGRPRCHGHGRWYRASRHTDPPAAATELHASTSRGSVVFVGHGDTALFLGQQPYLFRLFPLASRRGTKPSHRRMASLLVGEHFGQV
jgi:hypothetical protein